MSIEIAVNPNTKVPSVATVLRGYFGLGEFGIKLVDSETVFRESDVKVVAQIPNTAFDTYQTDSRSNGNLTGKVGGVIKFQKGNTFSRGRIDGSKNKKNQSDDRHILRPYPQSHPSQPHNLAIYLNNAKQFKY